MRAIALMVFVLILSGLNYVNAFHADITIDGAFDDGEAIEDNSDDEGDTFGGPEHDTGSIHCSVLGVQSTV